MNRLSRTSAGVLTAAMLAAAVTGCGSNGTSEPERTPNTPPPGRIAPVEAGYSLATTPEYFAKLDDAGAELSTYYGEYTPDQALDALDQLKKQPVAEWIGGDVTPATVSRTVNASGDSIPVFVLYHIPDRDVGQFSAGGADTNAEYLTWAKSVSAAIGTHDAVVILEPDALAHVPELPEDEAATRVKLLANLLRLFAANNPQTAVYLDAGNSAWRTPKVTADLLTRVQRQGATIPGIALNVSNFRSEKETREYSEAISRAFGTPLYTIIDESRNGAPPLDRRWCNPLWARTGAGVDATFDPRERFEQLYIKRPGESDGVCGASTQKAGQFDNNLLWRQLGQLDVVS